MNVQRARWDSRANPKSVKEYTVPNDVAVEIGDLMWLDRRPTLPVVARPASDALLWTGTLAGSQGKLAELFLGVAMSAKIANDGNTKVRIAGKGVYSFTVTTPTTFEIGDLVGGSRDGSSNALLDQEVVRIGAPGTVLGALTESMAIGAAAKKYATATSIVEIEILGRAEAGGGIKAFLSS